MAKKKRKYLEKPFDLDNELKPVCFYTGQCCNFTVSSKFNTVQNKETFIYYTHTVMIKHPDVCPGSLKQQIFSLHRRSVFILSQVKEEKGKLITR